MESLGNRWKLFLGIVLDPLTLVLILSVIVIILFTVWYLNSPMSLPFAMLIAVPSAILGGRITRHWVNVTESRVVVTRGKTAVRGLTLLLRNITALEKRVGNFIERKDEIENFPEVTKRNYEEIAEVCEVLEKEAINCIENWSDLIPEVGTGVATSAVVEKPTDSN
jgi:hypothetical protein